MAVIMGGSTDLPSVSTSAHYIGDISEYSSADYDAARILMSLSASCPSSSEILPPPPWKTKRKRSCYDIAEAMAIYEFLQSDMGQSVDNAVKLLKIFYKKKKNIVASVEIFEILRSEGLDRDQMLEFFNRNLNNGEKKRKIVVQSQQQTESKDLGLKTPTMMAKRKKENTDTKRIKILELNGEDDSKEGTKSYECNECKEVFASFQALGGHTASHNRKKKTEEAIQTRPDLSETEGFVNGGEEGVSDFFADGDEGKTMNCVYKCNLCSKSFPTGQALGGHKTCHRKIAEVKEEVVTKLKFHFDLNAFPPDDEDCTLISSSEFQSQLLQVLPE